MPVGPIVAHTRNAEYCRNQEIELRYGRYSYLRHRVEYIEDRRHNSSNPLDIVITHALCPVIIDTDDIHIRNLLAINHSIEISANSPVYGQLQTQLLRHEHTDRRRPPRRTAQTVETALLPDSPAMCALSEVV